jgi:peptide/nickel transport system substrate-binding protein
VGYFEHAPLNPGFGQGDVIYMFDGTAYRTWFIESLSGTSSITLNLWRGSYTFNIRTSPTIYFWNETGAAVDIFDVDDAEYSFKRGLVQDTGPQCMFYKPFFGTMNSDPFDSNTTEPSAMALAHLIDSVVEKSGNDLIINLGLRFPDNAFKQILCNTYGSIVSKEFSVGIGCWNGDLYADGNGDGYPDWWDSGLVRRASRSPYDVRTGSYPYVYSFRYCGTGPYRVATFDSVGLRVVLQKNPGYWRGWPTAGSNSSLDTIEIDYIANWFERKAAFLSGDIDTCAVPRANMYELLQAPNKDAEPVLIGGKPVIKTIKNIVPAVSTDAYYFTFTIANTSAYIGTGTFPSGIPTDFFNNTHVRKAFACSFNHTMSISEAWWGEATREFTPLREGLYPDYRNVTAGYDINYSAAEAELKSALFNGQSVWDTGFTLTGAYTTGADARRMYAEMTREFFNTLSTFDGRVGPAFTINLVSIDWATYIDQFYSQQLPIWYINWLGEFADADNLMRPYLHSDGDFAQFQNYTLANGWGSTHGVNYPTLSKDQLIDLALVTQDGPERAKMYADLENVYLADCPSLALPTPTTRTWCQYWVKGWYYNALYPSSCFYTMWKQDDCWFDVNGPTMGVSDGIVNMRDIQYLIIHFNAKALRAGKPLDSKWVGVYGANGGVDPYGDRTCNMRDIQGAILHFNHKENTSTP